MSGWIDIWFLSNRYFSTFSRNCRWQCNMEVFLRFYIFGCRHLQQKPILRTVKKYYIESILKGDASKHRVTAIKSHQCLQKLNLFCVKQLFKNTATTLKYMRITTRFKTIKLSNINSFIKFLKLYILFEYISERTVTIKYDLIFVSLF